MFEIVGREEQVFEQWEQGAKVSNPCMKAGDEVVFRNASGATAVMIAREESGQVVCDVPNKLLQMCCNILVDLEQGMEQHSDCQTTFIVNPAQKPDGYKCVDNSVPDTRISFNDLKDKPFYESTEVLFDQRVEFTADNEFQHIVNAAWPIKGGDAVKVNWGGVDYECEAVDIPDEGVVMVGNVYGDGSAPFLLIVVPFEGITIISSVSGVNHECYVKIEKSVIHPIDPKFLPVDYLKQLIAEVTGK